MGLKYGTQRAWTQAGAGGGSGKGNELLNTKTSFYITVLPPALLVTPVLKPDAKLKQSTLPAGWLRPGGPPGLRAPPNKKRCFQHHPTCPSGPSSSSSPSVRTLVTGRKRGDRQCAIRS